MKKKKKRADEEKSKGKDLLSSGGHSGLEIFMGIKRSGHEDQMTSV